MLVHHRLRLLAFPMRTTAVFRRWPNVGSPRFPRDPFVRDGVFDLGRASAPRISAWPRASVAPSRLSIGIFPSGSRCMYVTAFGSGVFDAAIPQDSQRRRQSSNRVATAILWM